MHNVKYLRLLFHELKLNFQDQFAIIRNNCNENIVNNFNECGIKDIPYQLIYLF